MRTLASKPKAPQPAVPPKSAIPARAHPILRLQRTIGNQALQRMLRAGHLPAPGIQTKLAVNQPGDIFEREADRVAEQVMRTTDPRLQRACSCGQCPDCHGASLQTKPVLAGGTGQMAAPPAVHEVLRSPGQPLDPATRAFMEPRFGQDFSGVRVHSGSAAEQSARDVNAHAYTVGHDIVFGAGGFAPATHEGRRLIAHELTHVVQQSGTSARIARKILTDLPEATRKTLRISRAGPAQSDLDRWIKSYFTPKSGASFSAGITAEFGPDITDASQQEGLKSIVGELEALSKATVVPATATEPEHTIHSNPEEWPLPANSIIDLALDLRAYGGEHAIFRFTRYTAGSADKVLIEKTQVLAPAPAAGGSPAPAQQPAPSAAGTFTGTVSVGTVNVTINPKFGNDHGKVIADAVGLLPDPIRAKIDGIAVDRGGPGKGPDGRNGDYDGNTDTVHLWDDVFTDSSRRYGTATDSAYQVVHELGHAVDLRPEFQAQRARDKASAEQAKLKEELRKVKPPDTNAPLTRPGDPDPDDADKQRIRAEIARLDTEIDAQNRLIATAKSIAGSELGSVTEQLTTDFARALAADGVTAVTNARSRNADIDTANKEAKRLNEANPTGPQRPMQPHIDTLTSGVSNYAAKNLREAFAENFAAYVLDEALLRAIRPATYAYFARNFPKTVPAPSSGTRP